MKRFDTRDTATLVHIAAALHEAACLPDEQIARRYGTHGLTLIVQRARAILADMAEDMPCVHTFDPDGICDWCGALKSDVPAC